MIHAPFPSFSAASNALHALSESEIPFQHASFVSNNPPPEGYGQPPPGKAHRGGMYAAIATSILAGGMAATGVGLFAAGPIAATLVGPSSGTLAGSLVSAMVDAGVQRDEAADAQRALEVGAVVLLVRIADDDVTRARAVLTAPESQEVVHDVDEIGAPAQRDAEARAARGSAAFATPPGSR